MDGIIEAGIALSKTSTPAAAATVLLHYCSAAAEPDLLAFYHFADKKSRNLLTLESFRGYKPEQEELSTREESICFILESRESVCLLHRKESPFSGILLSSAMNSGMAAPLVTDSGRGGILFLNYLHPYRFSFQHIKLIEKLIQTALPRF